MAFQPAYPHLIHTVTLPEGTGVTTGAKGQLVKLSGGYVKNPGNWGSGDLTGEMFGVMAENGHSDTASGSHDVKVYVITPESVWLADATASPADSNMGIVNQISSAGEVDLDTSDQTPAMVVPFEIYRAASDQKVLVRFVDSAIQGSS